MSFIHPQHILTFITICKYFHCRSQQQCCRAASQWQPCIRASGNTISSPAFMTCRTSKPFNCWYLIQHAGCQQGSFNAHASSYLKAGQPSGIAILTPEIEIDQLQFSRPAGVCCECKRTANSLDPLQQRASFLKVSFETQLTTDCVYLPLEPPPARTIGKISEFHQIWKYGNDSRTW